MNEDNSFPIEILEIKKSIFFGLISFSFYLEDRRPDLNYEQARNELGYKYKLQGFVKIFNKKYSFIMRSLRKPSFYFHVNGKSYEQE